MYNNSDELVFKLNAVESTCAVEFYTVVDTSRSPVHNTLCPLHWVRDISLHKHPRSGKKFIPTAPSTKAMLVEEANGCKGPSRIFDKTSMKAGGVIDCELAIELPRDSK